MCCVKRIPNSENPMMTNLTQIEINRWLCLVTLDLYIRQQDFTESEKTNEKKKMKKSGMNETLQKL